MNQLLLIACLLLLGPGSLCAQSEHLLDTLKSNPGFGGPSSVDGQIDRDASHKTDFLQSYFDFKNALKEESGFSYGIDYFSNYQTVSESLGEKSGFSGVFRVFGSWDLVGKKNSNKGSLIFKVENRHKYGNYIVPQSLGSEIGYAGLTSITFSNMGWGMTNFYWQQQLLNNRLAFVVGILDATDFFNIYGLADPWNDVSNLTFSTGAHIPVPNQGLGFAIRGLVTENIYILAGLEDANGDPTNPMGSFDSFFGDAEYFTHVEAGLIGDYAKRFTDNAHISYWHAAKRKAAGIPEGWGLALSLSKIISNYWEPFIRAGYADKGGAMLENSLDLGLGYHFPDNNNQLSLGASWGKPSESTFGEGLRDQYTVELYYRMHVARILTITPDIQLLINPAMNPSKDIIALFGLRGRVSF